MLGIYIAEHTIILSISMIYLLDTRESGLAFLLWYKFE